jgi:hypothetical protein
MTARTIRLMGCVLALASLAGCIANSSSHHSHLGNPPPATGKLSIKPASATIAAGDTQQFKVAKDTKVVWKVNNIAGGNRTVGTISADGLYTAPKLPPALGEVTLTAISKSDSSNTGRAKAKIRYSNASLAGAYVLSSRGQLDGGPFAAIGRFVADGNGHIDKGLKDLNAPRAVVTGLEFDGNYRIDTNGTGQAVLVSARGRVELHFVLDEKGIARVIRADPSASAEGALFPQHGNASGEIDGDYVFRVMGHEGRYQAAAVGRFTGNGAGDIDSGVVDRDRGSAVTRAIAFTGAYKTADDGHGAVSLASADGTRHYTYYAVSPKRLVLLRIDKNAPASGRVLAADDAGFAKSDVSGDYVFYLRGDESPSTRPIVGAFKADGDGGMSDAILDRGGSGIDRNPEAFTARYSVTSDGRSIAKLDTQNGRAELAFYLQSADRALVLETDGTIRVGEFIARKSDNWSESTLDGPYAFAGAGSKGATLGRVVFDGNGRVRDGVEIQAGGGSAIALGGKYSLADAGRGKLDLETGGGGHEYYIVYPLGSRRALLLGAEPGATPLAWLREQWPGPKVAHASD